MSEHVSRRVVETGTETVKIEVVDRIGVITLNRPERRNALHDEMYLPIVSAIESFVEADDVGCIVVTGAGAGFCAGGDIREGSGRLADGTQPSPEERVELLTANSRMIVLLREAPIITIAAVNGAAVGAGLAIALACDFRIASPRARFATAWIRLGFSGDMGGPWLLAHRLGEARALELLASNRTVDAIEAFQMGMVERLVADQEDFEAAWRQWASEFANGPQLALGSMKANVANASRLSLADAVRTEAELMIETALSADHREGVRAWVQKREPKFGPKVGST